MDSVDAWANELEDEATNHPLVVAANAARTVAALDQVAQAVEKHRRQHMQEEGEEVETLQIMIPDAADQVKPLGPAPKIKIKDLMPKGQANQTGKLNPDQFANLPNKANCAEFFIVADTKSQDGMSLPDKKPSTS